MSVTDVVLRLMLEAEDRTKPGIDQMNAGIEKVEQRVNAGKLAIAGLAGALSGTLGGALSDAARAAADEEAGIARLQQSLAATSDAGDQWNAAVDAMIDRAQSLAFSDDQARGGLALLAQETGSTEEALRRLPIAMDLARAKHIDLETASRLLGRVSDENTKALQRLGISVENGATQTEVLAKVQRVSAGQAEAYGNSTKGALDRVGIAANNLKENVGGALGPFQLLVALLPGLSVATSAAAAVVTALATAEGRATIAKTAHAIATGVVSAATKAFTIAQGALNLVLSANPIGIVVLALAGLAVGLKYAYDHSESFRNVVNQLFDWLGNLLGPLRAVWDTVTGFAKSLGLVGPESKKMADDVDDDVDAMAAKAAAAAARMAANVAASAKDMGSGVAAEFQRMKDQGVGASQDMEIDSILAAGGLAKGVKDKIAELVTGTAGLSEQQRDKLIDDMQYARLETALRARGLKDDVVAQILGLYTSTKENMQKAADATASNVARMKDNMDGFDSSAVAAALDVKLFRQNFEELPTEKHTYVYNDIFDRHHVSSDKGGGTDLIAAASGYEGIVGPGFGGPRVFLAGEGASAEMVRIAPVGASSSSGGGRGGVNVNIAPGAIVVGPGATADPRAIAEGIGEYFRRRGIAAGAPA